MTTFGFLLFIAIANSLVLFVLFAIILKDQKVIKSGLLYISSMVHHMVNILKCMEGEPEVEEGSSEEVEQLVSELMDMLEEYKSASTEKSSN